MRRRGTPGPLAIWQANLEITMLAVEASWIIGWRLMGLSGHWKTDRHEPLRMWAEKPGAMMRSAHAAGLAASQGAAPITVMAAATKPLRKRTRANVRRLSRLGPGAATGLGPTKGKR
jgi:hypothetical protein